MPLMTLRDVLEPAVPQRYAVGSFNVTNHDFVEGVLAAAEETGTPVILSVAEVHFRYLDLGRFVPYLKQRIAQSPVPVVLHLDHGTKKETLVKAIHWGFSSVMFDGSTLEWDDNIAQTRELADLAHMAGVSIEAELGHVAGGEGDFEGGSEVDTGRYTDPEQAAEFVHLTGVDALAVAVGTVHGPYRQTPELDLPRLAAIRQNTTVPLVLHGGSGLTEADFQAAIARGINKVNFYTENALLAVEAVKEALAAGRPMTYPDLTAVGRGAITANTKRQIAVFGTQPM